jgi:hypothetical protein
MKVRIMNSLLTRVSVFADAPQPNSYLCPPPPCPPAGEGPIGNEGFVCPVFTLPPTFFAAAAAAPARLFLVIAQSHSSVQLGGLCKSQCALQFVGVPPPGQDDAEKAGENAVQKAAHAATMTTMDDDRIATSIKYIHFAKISGCP